MWIHLLLLIVTLGFGTAYNVDMAAWYDSLAGAMADAHIGICVQALVGAGILVLMAVVTAQMNAYIIMLPVARFLLEASLLAVSVLAFGALYLVWTLDKNLWQDMGAASLVPFIGVVTATMILYLFDFNYPYKQKILGYLVLTAISLVLVFAL